SKTGAPPSAGTRSLFSKKSVSLFREMTFRKSPRGEAFEIALFAGFPQCRDGLSPPVRKRLQQGCYLPSIELGSRTSNVLHENCLANAQPGIDLVGNVTGPCPCDTSKVSSRGGATRVCIDFWHRQFHNVQDFNDTAGDLK
ncbi:hypothetical protein, partial [Mesorhizobium sp. M4B.F.Ca.ET.089.01.1.1]|uniref:hypothetical protein n=1 Tax=Mesorhizobium sp. M4B.F.Ca.ET.089.01.1.1 TaxID=2496662 RepID=UPI001AEC8796